MTASSVGVTCTFLHLRFWHMKQTASDSGLESIPTGRTYRGPEKRVRRWQTLQLLRYRHEVCTTRGETPFTSLERQNPPRLLFLYMGAQRESRGKTIKSSVTSKAERQDQSLPCTGSRFTQKIDQALATPPQHTALSGRRTQRGWPLVCRNSQQAVFAFLAATSSRQIPTRQRVARRRQAHGQSSSPPRAPTRSSPSPIECAKFHPINAPDAPVAANTPASFFGLPTPPSPPSLPSPSSCASPSPAPPAPAAAIANFDAVVCWRGRMPGSLPLRLLPPPSPLSLYGSKYVAAVGETAAGRCRGHRDHERVGGRACEAFCDASEGEVELLRDVLGKHTK